MKNLLLGNGITIQFGGFDYTNSSIIRRAINNMEIGNFPTEIFLDESGYFIEVIELLCKELPSIVKGTYDEFAIVPTEKNTLSYLKDKYKNNFKLKIEEIGIEDYFFLLRLVCNRLVPELDIRKNAKDELWCAFVDAIYNNGRIQEIYKKYPDEFINHLNSYDHIFTTNYDNNIDMVTEKEIFHLHGAFHIIDDKYLTSGLKNKLLNTPADNTRLIDGYEHLYSSVIMDFSGTNKYYDVNVNSNANSAVKKLIKAYETNSIVKDDVDSWANSDNIVVRKCYETIMAKLNNPNAEFAEYYYFDMLSSIEDELSIIGLSPNNDTHIFEEIKSNLKVNKIIYYYFDKSDQQCIKDLFPDKHVQFISVKDFWSKL